MRADETVDIRSQEPRNAKETERGVGANEHYDNGCGNEPPSETAREHDLDLTSLTLFRSMITQQFRQPLSRERGAQLTAVAQRRSARNASSSAVVSGFRKNAASGMTRDCTPCLWRVSPTTGPIAATTVLPSALLISSTGAAANRRSTCGVLVNAMASMAPDFMRSIRFATAWSSTASA